MDRWEHQRSVRVPWLAARLERDGERLTFDPDGVAAVGRWCGRWFASPGDVDDQPTPVWVERHNGRQTYSREAVVVADAVAGFVESVLWDDLHDARRLFTPVAPQQATPPVGANEPGLGYAAVPGVPLPWQLLGAARGVAAHGGRGADLRAGLVRVHAMARARLISDRARASDRAVPTRGC